MHDSTPQMPTGVAAMILDAFNHEDGLIPRPWFVLWAYSDGILSYRENVGEIRADYPEGLRESITLVRELGLDGPGARFGLEIVIGRATVLRWPLMSLVELAAEIDAMTDTEYTPRLPISYGGAPQLHETDIRAAEQGLRMPAHTACPSANRVGGIAMRRTTAHTHWSTTHATHGF